MGVVTSCPRDAQPQEVGVLCQACAALITPTDTLLSDHVQSPEGLTAAAWLIDGFGTPHPVSEKLQRIGREPGSELKILHGSVSKKHGEIVRTSTGWQVRDVGSKNGIRVDGRTVEGRAPLTDGAVVHVGDVALLFVDRPTALTRATPAVATTRSSAAGFRAILRGPTVELCVLGGEAMDVGGTLLHRAPGGTAWGELALPALEYHLLRTLCTAALAARDSPQRSRGAVVTKSLAKALPFQSRYANDENVRQVVRRLRLTLDEIGAEGVVETVPGRGYFVAWPVTVS